jgi:ribonucleotide reductase beta subunit family protein with ferritin-like domain
LEAIRFYVSFAFAERDLLEGDAKIIKLNLGQKTAHKKRVSELTPLIAA